MQFTNHIHLKINMICLILIGIWPLQLKQPFTIFNHLHKVYSIFVFVYFVLFEMSQFYELFHILGGDIYELVANLGVSLLYSVCIVKIVVCKSKSVADLIHQIRSAEKKILNGGNETIKNIYMDNVRLNYWANKLLIWVGVVTISPFYVNPLIIEYQNPPEAIFDIINNSTIVYRKRPLPFSSWFPFDRYKHYYVSYAIHIIAGTFGATFTVTTDILFYGLLIFAIGQIKILQHYLTNFKMYASEYMKRNDCDQDTANDIIVRECMKEHKVIIKYVEDLDKSMRLLMLLDFALASMQMAMLGFQIIFVGFGIQQLFALEYLGAMLIQLFLFYWHANEILLESTQISTAIWDSDWFECKPSLKRSFMLMMIRSSRPLTLSVGPFYAMSTQTALSILRAAYSYVALLRQTYIRKEE